MSSKGRIAFGTDLTGRAKKWSRNESERLFCCIYLGFGASGSDDCKIFASQLMQYT